MALAAAVLVVRITWSICAVVVGIAWLARHRFPVLQRLVLYGKHAPGVRAAAAQSALSLNNATAWRLFYLVAVLSTSLALAFVRTGTNLRRIDGPGLMLLFLLVHQAKRLVESVYVHRYSPGRLAWYHVLLGTAYYLALPLGPVLEAMYTPRFGKLLRGERGLVSMRLTIAVCLFFYFSGVQFLAHAQLAALRLPDVQRRLTLRTSASRRPATPAERLEHDRQRRLSRPYVQLDQATGHRVEYRIPAGGWFNFICCPHYLAEIAIYFLICLVVPGGFSLSFLATTAFVSVNLTVSALATLQWYRRKFPDDFPTHRRALVPFLL